MYQNRLKETVMNSKKYLFVILLLGMGVAMAAPPPNDDTSKGGGDKPRRPPCVAREACTEEEDPHHQTRVEPPSAPIASTSRQTGGNAPSSTSRGTGNEGRKPFPLRWPKDCRGHNCMSKCREPGTQFNRKHFWFEKQFEILF